MDQSRVETIIGEASRRFMRNLRDCLPSSYHRVLAWRDLSTLADEGLAARSFPLLYLPVWISPPEALRNDTEFHVDIACSSLNGFAFVRLIDDVTDGDTPFATRQLLPTAAHFHTHFQAAYQHYFESTSIFWTYFRDCWCAQADLTTKDSFFTDVGFDDFVQASSKKSAGAFIPLAAAAIRNRKEASLRLWQPFLNRLGMLQQMANDVFGWRGDSARGTATLFLSMAAKHKHPNETVSTWIRREGICWARTFLTELLDDVADQARSLDSPPVLEWLARRRTIVEDGLARASSDATFLEDWAQYEASFKT